MEKKIYNMSEENKKRLKEYQENYCEAKKHLTNANMSIKICHKIAIARIFFVFCFFLY